MPTIYSTPADRRAASSRARTRGTANREFAGLVAATVLVAIGLWLAYRSQAPALAEADKRIAAGTIVNLGTLGSDEPLWPVLQSAYPDPAERRLVASRIESRLLGLDTTLGVRQRLESVGALGRLEVPASRVRETGRLGTLRARLDALNEAARAARSAPVVSLTLFSPEQLAAVKRHLVVRTPADYRRALLVAALLFIAGFFGAHLWARLRRASGDPLILPAVELLCGIGLFTMVEVRDPLRDLLLFARFAQGVAAGCVIMAAVRHLDLQRSPLSRLSYVPLACAMLLSAALIVFGSGPGNSDAKVNLLGVQPVEAIRLLVLLFFAGYFANRWEFLRELREPKAASIRILRAFDVPRLDYVLPVVAAVALILVFFFLQKDLGPALVLSCMFLALYGIARRRFTMVAVGFCLLLAGFLAGYWLGVPRTVVQRVAMWQSPFDNAVRGGDQVAHALWALASGGLTGTGIGQGNPSFVPAVHTDLVLAAIAEELGWVGLASVVVLSAWLFVRAARIALTSAGDYAFFVSAGAALSLVFPLLIISAGMLGLLPLTGVVTPFLSYGRSAMLANFAALGLLLGASDRAGGGPQRAEFLGPVRWVGALLGVAALIVVGRAADVQILRADTFAAAPALSVQSDGGLRYSYNPRLLAAASQLVRGTVVDRNGVPLATSRPEVLAKAQETLTRLGVRPDEACPGSDQRCYPFGGLTYHLLGDIRSQTDWAAQNTSFVERDQDSRLRGYDDHVRTVEVRDPRTGRTEKALRRSLTELLPLLRHRGDPGHPDVQRLLDRPRDLTLTIDIRLQQRSADILRRRIEQSRTERGALVVLDDRGEMLAAVSYPSPDTVNPVVRAAAPGARPDAPPDPRLLDRARYGVYPPGSSFKIVTAAAVLRTRPELAEQTVTCGRLPDGRVGARLPGWSRPVRDDRADTVPHGTIDMSRALVVSCNAYFATLGLRLGAPALSETAHLFDITLGQPETPAELRDTLPFAAYGQGQVLATPFKMARVAATIAAGGDMPLGRWILDAADPRTGPPRAVLTPAQAGVLGRTMRAVVTGGTGRVLARIQPAIAGKTGTAEVQNRPSHSWFVGFAPYGGGGRRIAFAVIVENGGYGANLAAPIAGELVQAASDLGLIGR